MPLVSDPQNGSQNDQLPHAIVMGKQTSEPKSDPILCPHCQRTASNGIKCKGICVADNDY